MASKMYDEAFMRTWSGDYDLNAAAIWARLTMSNTTCGTEQALHLADFTTIDPCDATGYADVQLATLAVNKDSVNHRGEFDAADVTFSGLSGDATRNIVGCLLYIRVDGTDANDHALGYVEFVATIPKESLSVVVPWNSEGIFQQAMAA